MRKLLLIALLVLSAASVGLARPAAAISIMKRISLFVLFLLILGSVAIAAVKEVPWVSMAPKAVVKTPVPVAPSPPKAAPAYTVRKVIPGGTKTRAPVMPVPRPTPNPKSFLAQGKAPAPAPTPPGGPIFATDNCAGN